MAKRTTEPKKPNRLPKDFNHMKPDDLEITDPDRAANEAEGIPVDREYPKHLHKFAGHGLMHDYVEVTDKKSEAKARGEGYMSPQEANAVGAKLLAKDAPKAAPKAKRGPKAKEPKVETPAPDEPVS